MSEKKKKYLTRREFMRLVAVTTAGATLASCAPTATPPFVLSEPPRPSEKPPEKPPTATKLVDTPTPRSTITPRFETQTPTSNPEMSYPPELQKLAWEEFQQSYPLWMERYTTTENTSTPQELRATWRDDPGSDAAPWGTVSEAQSYAMIYAAVMGDTDTHTRLWNYAKTKFNDNGLMVWLVDQAGEPAFNKDIGRRDTGAASDADINIAESQIILLRQGRSIDEEGTREHLQNILKHDIDPATGVFMPGDSWGGPDIVNLAYWSPLHAQIFNNMLPDPLWQKVDENQRQIIDKVHLQMGGKVTGLVPDWATKEGKSAALMSNNPQADNYSWTASRYPWCQARGLLYGSDSPAQTHARQLCTKLNSFFETVGQDDIATSYTLDGQPLGEERNNNVFIAGAACVSVTSNDPDYQRSILQKLVDTRSQGYFPDSLRLLALATLSGRYITH